jgi:hypothetical protein
MGQRVIVLYIDRKELSAIALHYDIVVALGSEPVSYSSVASYLCEAIFASSNCPANIREAELQFEDCDQAILLSEQPFASIRESARLTYLPRITIHRRLTQSLEFHVHHLRWIPIFCHTLKNWIA